MMILHYFFVIFTLLHSGLSDRTDELDDLLVYEIDVQFYPVSSSMVGRSKMTFGTNGVNGSSFYLHGELFVDSIKVGDSPLLFSQRPVLYRYNYSLVAREIIVQRNFAPGESIEVYYSGHFHQSKASSPSNYMCINEEDGVLLRSYGYSLWYPTFARDDGTSYRANFQKVAIRTPANYVPVFVGDRISEDVDGEFRTSVWQALETDIFLTQLTSRKFKVLQEDQLFVYHLDSEESGSNARAILTFSKEILENFQNSYSANNSERTHHIMQMPKYGDISSGNVVGISTVLWNDFEVQIWPKIVLAHEFVHPFVSINVASSSEMSALVVEGFPSYFHLPVLETYLGQQWYRERMKGIEENYIYKKENKKHPRGWTLPPEKPVLDITFDEIGSYKDVFLLNDRVILMFDYFRRKMGKEKFWEYCKELFNRDGLVLAEFEALTEQYLPGSRTYLRIWLKSNDFPDEFHCNY